jgi:hypothetical protein
MSTTTTRIRAGAAALAAAGVLFLAYPALRPWHNEGTVAGATASMSSAAAAGLLLLAAAAILAAIAVWRSHVLPRTSAILFAAGMALFLPQFFSPAAVRIAHGILLATGSIILAAALWASAGRLRGAAIPPAGRFPADVTRAALHPAGRRIPS